MPVIIARKLSPRSPSITADQLARLARLRAASPRRCAILGEGNVSARDDAETFPISNPGIRLAGALSAARGAYLERFGAAGVPAGGSCPVHAESGWVFVAIGGSAAGVPAITDMAVKAARVLATALACGGPCHLSAADVRRIAGRSDEHYRQRVLGLRPDAGARMGA